jgi:hypothetical protein
MWQFRFLRWAWAGSRKPCVETSDCLSQWYKCKSTPGHVLLVVAHGSLEGIVTLRLQLFPQQELDALPAEAEYTQLGEFRNSMSGRTLAFNVLAASAIRHSPKAPAVGTKCRRCGAKAHDRLFSERLDSK